MRCLQSSWLNSAGSAVCQKPFCCLTFSKNGKGEAFTSNGLQINQYTQHKALDTSKKNFFSHSSCSILHIWSILELRNWDSERLSSLLTQVKCRREKNFLCVLNLFPRAAIRECHKLDGLKHKCVLSLFWRLEVQNQRDGRAMFPLELWARFFLASP